MASSFESGARSARANGQFSGLAGIAVDRQGCVYVADSGNHRVQKFTAEGKFLAAWGGKEPSQGNSTRPRVSRWRRVARFLWPTRATKGCRSSRPRASRWPSWGHRGKAPGSFKGQGLWALDAAGNLYVTDAPKKGRAAVLVFDSGGKYLREWGPSPAHNQALDGPCRHRGRPVGPRLRGRDIRVPRPHLPTTEVTRWQFGAAMAPVRGSSSMPTASRRGRMGASTSWTPTTTEYRSSLPTASWSRSWTRPALSRTRPVSPWTRAATSTSLTGEDTAVFESTARDFKFITQWGGFGTGTGSSTLRTATTSPSGPTAASTSVTSSIIVCRSSRLTGSSCSSGAVKAKTMGSSTCRPASPWMPMAKSTWANRGTTACRSSPPTASSCSNSAAGGSPTAHRDGQH